MRGLLMASAAAAALAIAVGPVGAVPEGPPYPSAAWTAREAANFAKTGEEPAREAADPGFAARWQQQSAANDASLAARDTPDISWTSFPGNLCASWSMQCTGDPYLYPGVDSFYDRDGTVVPVNFYDRGCARVSGRVWAPRSSRAGDQLPGVVIETGSVQAPETLYWWFAEDLVRAGYVVMTYDVRGQGRSDNHTPSGQQGSNANSSVFWDGLVDAIDFFHSTPIRPYPGDGACAATHTPAPTTPRTAANPFADRLDEARLGIVGHSLGATGVSVVQGLVPWPGRIDRSNPVAVTVAWDNLLAPSERFAGQSVPQFVIRTPALGFSNDYTLTPTPYTAPPDPEAKKTAFAAWAKAGVPAAELVIQGGTHYEYSRLPTFPATSWTTWGNPMAAQYSLAWIDRWLKHPGEAGYDTADSRLLADRDWRPRMSFYLRSARAFPDRAGRAHVCADIRAGCADVAAPAGASGATGSSAAIPAAAARETGRALPATGRTFDAAVAFSALAAGLVLARVRRPWRRRARRAAGA